MARMSIDHVAVIVRSIEDAVERFGLSADLSAIAEFPGEGTRELYLGGSKLPGRLLLTQPLGPGPYERAMGKRGPGLHHVAFAVPDLGAFTQTIEATGWLLHPASLRTMTEVRQIWLCRPGVRILVEVSEGARRYEGDPLVERVTVPATRDTERLVAALDVDGLGCTVGEPASLRVSGREINLEATLGGA